MSTLYRETLMAHAKQPFGATRIPPGTEHGEALNPGCGDDIRVKLSWTPDGILTALEHDLQGCAVSAASASMAARLLAGRTRAGVEALCGDVLGRLGREGFGPEWGDVQSLNGLEQYPARIHCARLVWMAVGQALAQGGKAAP